MLRDLDFGHYAASLAIPKAHRGAVQSLWAFAADVAAIRERVSEPAPGEIRLQWWVDALEGEGHGTVRANPVAAALLDTVDHHGLPAGPLLRLLAARRFDLFDDPMPDMDQFEGYAGETISVLYQYAAMMLSGDTAEAAADASGHLGVAHALAGHVRAFGFNASRGQIYLPLSVFSAHGVREVDILSGTPGPEIDAALAQLREIAGDHLAKAKAQIGALSANVRPAFASTALVEQLLRAESRRTGPDVFAIPAEIPAFKRLVAVFCWMVRQ